MVGALESVGSAVLTFVGWLLTVGAGLTDGGKLGGKVIDGATDGETDGISDASSPIDGATLGTGDMVGSGDTVGKAVVVG